MQIEMALKIHDQILNAVLPYAGVPHDGEFPSLPDCPLSHMLRACDLVRELNHPAVFPDGRARSLYVIPEERLIAAVYALQQFGGAQGLAELFGWAVKKDQKT